MIPGMSISVCGFKVKEQEKEQQRVLLGEFKRFGRRKRPGIPEKFSLWKESKGRIDRFFRGFPWRPRSESDLSRTISDENTCPSKSIAVKVFYFFTFLILYAEKTFFYLSLTWFHKFILFYGGPQRISWLSKMVEKTTTTKRFVFYFYFEKFLSWNHIRSSLACRAILRFIANLL